MTTKNNKPANAMAFYHRDGFTAAWNQAKMYAGQDGRIATMPDIVRARLSAKNPREPNSPWEKFYTTLSAEYLGFDRDGKKVIIVAHGVGPMATLDGIQKAYSWEYNHRDTNRRGGRITQQEFWDLADGKFGSVSIINLEDYKDLYQYPLSQVLTANQAATDPLLKARFGKQCEEYVKYHAEIARAYHRAAIGLKPEERYANKNELKLDPDYLSTLDERHLKQGAENSNPYIIDVKDDGQDCYYLYSPIEEGFAFAHLLSTGGLCRLSHENGNNSLVLDVACHDWTDGTRLVGIQKADDDEEKEINIFDGPDPHQILRRHFEKLWQAVKVETEASFCQLMDFANNTFTQYLKVGNKADTHEPEYLVKKMEKIGDPILFRTTIDGYHIFFTYDIREVKAIAPPKANAYQFVSDPIIECTNGSPSHHTAMLQFYNIEADTTQRLIRVDKLARNYELLMELI